MKHLKVSVFYCEQPTQGKFKKKKEGEKIFLISISITLSEIVESYALSNLT